MSAKKILSNVFQTIIDIVTYPFWAVKTVLSIPAMEEGDRVHAELFAEREANHE